MEKSFKYSPTIEMTTVPKENLPNQDEIKTGEFNAAKNIDLHQLSDLEEDKSTKNFSSKPATGNFRVGKVVEALEEDPELLIKTAEFDPNKTMAGGDLTERISSGEREALEAAAEFNKGAALDKQEGILPDEKGEKSVNIVKNIETDFEEEKKRQARETKALVMQVDSFLEKVMVKDSYLREIKLMNPDSLSKESVNNFKEDIDQELEELKDFNQYNLAKLKAKKNEFLAELYKNEEFIDKNAIYTDDGSISNWSYIKNFSDRKDFYLEKFPELSIAMEDLMQRKSNLLQAKEVLNSLDYEESPEKWQNNKKQMEILMADREGVSLLDNVGNMLRMVHERYGGINEEILAMEDMNIQGLNSKKIAEFLKGENLEEVMAAIADISYGRLQGNYIRSAEVAGEKGFRVRKVDERRLMYLQALAQELKKNKEKLNVFRKDEGLEELKSSLDKQWKIREAEIEAAKKAEAKRLGVDYILSPRDIKYIPEEKIETLKA